MDRYSQREKHVWRASRQGGFGRCKHCNLTFFANRSPCITHDNSYIFRYRKLEKIDWIDFGRFPKIGSEHEGAKRFTKLQVNRRDT